MYIDLQQISLEFTSYILRLKKYTITHQLMNYSGKIIGLEITKGGMTGMIPCFPSAPIKTLKNIQMDRYISGVAYDKTNL